MARVADTDGELDLRRILEVLRERKFYVIGTFFVVLAIVAVITVLTPPTYRATAVILIKTTNVPLQTLGLPMELASLVSGRTGDLSAHVEMLKSRPVLEKLRMRLENDPEYVAAARTAEKRRWFGLATGSTSNPVSLEDLQNAITVRQVSNTNLLRIEATAGSQLLAQKIANHLVAAYQEADQARARYSIQVMLVFLDQKIEETKRQLELSAEELAEYARHIGMSWEAQAFTAKMARLEQLLAEAAVQLEDTRAQLDTVERFLADVKEELLEQFTGPEGSKALIEVSDKLALIRKIQQEIVQLERDREAAFRAGNYIKAQDLESQIVRKRQNLESTAAQQFKILEQLPQYEKLIDQQLELKLKVIALENRVAILQRSIRDELQRMIDVGVQLARRQRELDVSESLYTLLLTQYAKTSVVEIGETGAVDVVNPAELPKSPVRPNRPLNLVIGVFLGVLAGVGVAFLRESLDTTFRSAQEVEQMLGVPVLAKIPRISSPRRSSPFQEIEEVLVSSLKPGGVEADAFATLATNLRFVSPDKPLRSLLVTSPGPAAGKSLVAANLALTWAGRNKRVALVDADLRRPVLEEVLKVNVEGQPGLAEVVVGEKSLEEIVQEVKFEGYGPLHFIPTGSTPPNVVEFFSSQSWEQLLAKLEEAYDLVILDSPPVNVVADPVVLSRRVSGVVLVVDAEKTTKKEVEAAHQALLGAGATLVGAVLNKVSRRRAGSYYYYGYGYHYRDKRRNHRNVKPRADGEAHTGS